MDVERDHLVYADADGRPEEPVECIDECPGCHYEGNGNCDAGSGNCAICDGEPGEPNVIVEPEASQS